MSVLISSNLIETPIFLYDYSPKDLVEYFVEAIERLAAMSKAQMKLQFWKLQHVSRVDSTKIMRCPMDDIAAEQLYLDLRRKRMYLLNSYKRKQIN